MQVTLAAISLFSDRNMAVASVISSLRNDQRENHSVCSGVLGRSLERKCGANLMLVEPASVVKRSV
jgi:hypothetical protein